MTVATKGESGHVILEQQQVVTSTIDVSIALKQQCAADRAKFAPDRREFWRQLFSSRV